MNEEPCTRYLIKFRAFDLDSGELYKWDMYESYPLEGVRASCPQEFTGLQDKNEQDIFIGDIVNYNGQNYLVRFRCGAYLLWKLENISTLKFWWFHDVFDKFREMEVVGNTFEHAEYLSQCLKNSFI